MNPDPAPGFDGDPTDPDEPGDQNARSRRVSPPPPAGPGRAFLMGGCGCLVAFLVLAVAAVAAGGRARIDPGGAVCLFVVGGLIGLVVVMIYNKGRRDARGRPDDGDRPGRE